MDETGGERTQRHDLEFLRTRVIERRAHDPVGDAFSFQLDRNHGVLDDDLFTDDEIFLECARKTNRARPAKA